MLLPIEQNVNPTFGTAPDIWQKTLFPNFIIPELRILYIPVVYHYVLN